MKKSKATFIDAVKKDWRGGFFHPEKAYRITVGRYVYYVRVHTDTNIRGEIDQYRLDLGGKKKGCVSIRVPYYASDRSKNKGHQTAFIKYLQHDDKCAVNQRLVEGYGTKHMVKTALAIVKENTNIRYFHLSDESHKTCTDGVKIALPYLMIAMNGKTYYEKNFHARIENAEEYRNYREALKRLELVPKDNIAFEDFVVRFGIPKAYDDIFRPYYDTATSFYDFFRQIRHNHKDTCKLLVDWIQSFIIKWVFEGREYIEHNVWEIQHEDIDKIEVTDWFTVDENSAEVFQVVEEDIQKVRKEQQDGGSYLGMFSHDDFL